jgi:DNA primase
VYPHDDAEAIARALHLKRGGKGWVGQCPCCRYKSGFTIAPNRDGLPLIYCHAGGCTFLDIATALHRLGLWPDPDPAYRQPDPVEIDATALALRIWRRSVAADGTVVERYLRIARGYSGPIPPTLRLAYGRYEGEGGWLPMMVAKMLDGDRQFRAVHRTYVGVDGSGKADVAKPKMTLGPTRGAVIPLAEPGPELVVSEGIENGLSLGDMLGLPAWAAGSAGNLAHLPLPSIVERVVIAADRDESGIGQRKAEAAAGLWTRQGRRVRIMLPPAGFADWNDAARYG